MDPNITTAPVFPGDDADGVAVVGARTEAVRHGWRVLAILSALMGFASISTDPYLPAMPAMGRALRADAGTVEWTISGYLIGFSLGQLLWGPIGDRHGRRLPLAIGLVLFVVGSAGCALAGSIWALIGWRVLQAVGACAGVVLARATVRDPVRRPTRGTNALDADDRHGHRALVGTYPVAMPATLRAQTCTPSPQQPTPRK